MSMTHSIFGLDHRPDTDPIIILPIPWDLTCSAGHGTAHAAQDIRLAAHHIDLSHPFSELVPDLGISMCPISEKWQSINHSLRSDANSILQAFEHSHSLSKSEQHALNTINTHTQTLNTWVLEESMTLLDRNQFPIVLGGAHGVGLGLLQALARQHPSFGILQIDAHMDLRNTYNGMPYSHATAMFHALSIDSVTQLTQVGVRDYAPSERDYARQHPNRITSFSDYALRSQQFSNVSWTDQCQTIIDTLPPHVFISLDVDGLDPSLCPNTGTPVPGGLHYAELIHLLDKLYHSNHTIIGAELVEVGSQHLSVTPPALTQDTTVFSNPNGSPGYDALVGAHLLYLLCGLFRP